MPADIRETTGPTATEAVEGEEINAVDAYRTARRNFEEFMARIEPLGFLSRSEISEQRSYVESAASDVEKMLDVAKSYSRDMISNSIAKNFNAYNNHLIRPLDDALESGVISGKSYGEWIAWMRDPGRGSMEKHASIESVLPNYLSIRRELARRRKELLADSRLGTLEKNADSTLRGKISTLRDNDAFLSSLTFSERKGLIANITASLDTETGDEKLFASFERELGAAVSAELISAASHERWIARFKKPGLSLKAKQYFVEYQWPSYRQAWERSKKERADIIAQPLFKELTKTDCKNLDTIKDNTAFVELHHDKKTALLAEVRACMLAKKERKGTLLSQTRSALETAAAAGYVSRNKIGPWLEHVMSGKRTLAELKRFIGDWAKVRYGFDRTERAMNKGTVPRGFNRLTEEKFLGLSYEQRRSYVEEAERRLHAEGSHVPHTNFTVLKGKIRHALDTEDWDEARQYLQEAWKGNNSEEDIRELQSMENYLKSFGKKEKKQEKKDPKTEVLRAASDIDGLLASAPDGLKPFYEKCLLYGGEATASMCQIIYNVKWCQDRNYLPDEPNILRHRALRETEHRLSAAGDGHKNGLENNLVTGFNSPSIRDDGFGPQNMFATKDESQTVAQKASEHKDDFTFRYWSNLIVPDVSRGQYHFASTQIHWRLKRAARTLEAHGFKYGTMELKAFRSLHASGASEAA